MKVIIEGDLEQISDVLGVSEIPRTSRAIKLAESAARRKAFADRRKLVTEAFKKVRYSPEDREIAEALLEGLRRITGVTDADLKIARQVIER